MSRHSGINKVLQIRNLVTAFIEPILYRGHVTAYNFELPLGHIDIEVVRVQNVHIKIALSYTHSTILEMTLPLPFNTTKTKLKFHHDKLDQVRPTYRLSAKLDQGREIFGPETQNVPDVSERFETARCYSCFETIVT